MAKAKEDIKVKNIPMRSCVVCRTKRTQSELLRIGYNSEKTEIYFNKGNGRGVYLCKQEECISAAKKRKSIARALKIAENDIDYATISEEIKR